LDKLIRVYDPDKNDELVQKNSGHSDAIRGIVHIPGRNQYVSVSWDQTVRIWHAHMKKGQRRIIATYNSLEINAAAVPEKEDIVEPSFSDLNPLIVPKLLNKGAFVKDTFMDRKLAEGNDHNDDEQHSVRRERHYLIQRKHASHIEQELRATLNELEQQLNEKLHYHSKKAKSRWNKPTIKKVE
jgi:hypothetical protein